VVERAQRGDREAFASIAFELSDRLMGLAHRILRDHGAAEEALQVALLRIWRDLPSLREPDAVDAWAARILVRACQDSLRHARRKERSLQLLPHEGHVDDASSRLADHEELERAFATLSADHRAVVVLHYYRDLPLAEISTALDIPIGTVKTHLHRAKRRCASCSTRNGEGRGPLWAGVGRPFTGRQ
jgi:RNA polymerase sigma-70 factor (ECF subfamily)